MAQVIRKGNPLRSIEQNYAWKKRTFSKFPAVYRARKRLPAKRCNTGQGLAFHPLQKRSACGGNIGEIIRHTGLV